MHKNKLWLVLVGVITLSALWYTGLTWYRYYNYSRLNAEIAPKTMSWHVVEHGSDTYTLEADYTFMTNGTTFSGSTDFSSEGYLNRTTAENAITNASQRSWKVWYDSNDPSHSSLEKDFPIKYYIYTIMLWEYYSTFCGSDSTSPNSRYKR